MHASLNATFECSALLHVMSLFFSYFQAISFYRMFSCMRIRITLVGIPFFSDRVVNLHDAVGCREVFNVLAFLLIYVTNLFLNASTAFWGSLFDS